MKFRVVSFSFKIMVTIMYVRALNLALIIFLSLFVDLTPLKIIQNVNNMLKPYCRLSP